MGVVSKALLLTCSQVSTRGDSGFQPRVPGSEAAGPIGGRSAPLRAPSRGQAMPARQDGPGPMRRDRAAGDWGSPLQLPRRNMRARWLLKFRREVSPEAPHPGRRGTAPWRGSRRGLCCSIGPSEGTDSRLCFSGKLQARFLRKPNRARKDGRAGEGTEPRPGWRQAGPWPRTPVDAPWARRCLREERETRAEAPGRGRRQAPPPACPSPSDSPSLEGPTPPAAARGAASGRVT